MGPAGRQFVYKDEFREILKNFQQSLDSGMEEHEAAIVRDKAMSKLTLRYEQGISKSGRSSTTWFCFQDCDAWTQSKGFGQFTVLSLASLST